MEGAPQIPEKEENIEKTKSSLGDKIKKWAKIGAIASVGFIPAKEAVSQSNINNIENKNKTEIRVDSTLKSIKESKNLENHNLDIVRENIKKAYKNYDSQLEWMNNNLSSPTYKERFKKEIGGEKRLEKLNQDMVTNDLLGERKKLLNDNKYKLVYDTEVSKGAFAQFKDGIVELPVFTTDDLKSVGIHEFAHDMTYSGHLMTEKANKLYQDSFSKEMTKEYLGQKYDLEKELYYSSPTERDARKKVLEYDLENLGVKKYKQTFMKKHYEEMLELMQKGKLSDDSVEFIKTTKPEYFLQIMNEIAENQVAKEDNQNLA